MPSSSVTADGTADAAHPSGTNAQKDYPDIVGRNGAANLLGGGRSDLCGQLYLFYGRADRVGKYKCSHLQNGYTN